ncbi:MAG: hypothetical protein JRH20_04935 [Deltaproteobacteria bacterium]|nr:hypothetical protein [Deltaproteobacteria bacterium]
MDPKTARAMIDKLCDEIDENHRGQSRFAEVMKVARTLGFGIAIGLATVGCGDDDDKVPDATAAYGVPDSVLVQDSGVDTIAGPDAAYGIPMDAGVPEAALPEMGLLYGIPADDGGQ